MTTTISADVFVRAQQIADDLKIDVSEAIERIQNADKAPLPAAVTHQSKPHQPNIELLPPGIWQAVCSEEQMILMAKGFPPASEDTVSREVIMYLKTAHDAKRLDQFGKDDLIPRGTLIYMTSENRNHVKGISRGAPDHQYMRVGWWGFIGCELKRRGKDGENDGKFTDQQNVAVINDIYAKAWSPAHVGMLVEAMDRRTGYKDPSEYEENNGKEKQQNQTTQKRQASYRKGRR